MAIVTRDDILSHLTDLEWLPQLIQAQLVEKLEPVLDWYSKTDSDREGESGESRKYYPEKGIVLIKYDSWCKPIKVPGIHPDYWVGVPQLILLETGVLTKIETASHSFLQKASFFDDEVITTTHTERQDLTPEEIEANKDQIAEAIFKLLATS